MNTLRTMICEDEPLARLHLRGLVHDSAALTLIGEAADGAEAVREIDRLRPDVVLLDIRMPTCDGLTVLTRISHHPAVVFTTAYDAHAVDAFELGAVDYLMKPFGETRFRKAVDRLCARVPERTADGRAPLSRSHLVVRHRGRLIPVDVRALERLSADDDLVVLHVRGKPLSLSGTLRVLLLQLDPSRFIRVHRSHVVNLDHVAALEVRDANRLAVRMRDGALVPASRAGTQLLRTALGSGARPATDG